MGATPDPRLETPAVRMIVPSIDKRDPNVSPAAGAVWTANLGIFVPHEFDQPIVIIQIHIEVTTQVGNVDCGVYDEAGNRIVANGAVAVGAAGVQTFNIADTTIAPGRYLIGISFSGAAAIKECTPLWAATAVGGTLVGVKQNAAAHPLPATVALSATTRLTIPLFSLETQY